MLVIGDGQPKTPFYWIGVSGIWKPPMTNKPRSFDQIPLELKSLPQWVCWRLETRDDKQKKFLTTPSGQNNVPHPRTPPHGRHLKIGSLDGCKLSEAQTNEKMRRGGVDVRINHCRDTNSAKGGT